MNGQAVGMEGIDFRYLLLDFYKKLGFIPQENDPLKLFLNFKDLDLSK